MADAIPPYDEVPLADMEHDEDEGMYYYKCPCGDLFEISQARAAALAVPATARRPSRLPRRATRHREPRRRNLMRASMSRERERERCERRSR